MYENRTIDYISGGSVVECCVVHVAGGGNHGMDAALAR